MTAKPPRLDSAPGRETLVVIVLTLLGAVLRLWSPARLGLVHFDEGIYALAGLWSLSPRGLAGIDPTIISYAPPGFPVLVGLSYSIFGVNDFAAILVSIGAGTLTIPVAAWLSRRTFGPGAGGAAAAFTALSGPHIAFSRMALTDASFLLSWLVAIGMGQRFFDRPNPARAFLLGLAVGLSQLFKYNGWISGAIVAASAIVWLLFHPDDWRTRPMAATWGWGLFAAIVAAIVYWPWFRFVDSHGGYSALLGHQRSYLGGLSSWPGHWSLQLAQQQFLSGGLIWVGCTGLVAALAMLISTRDLALERRLLPRILMETAGLIALCLICGSSWWIVLVWISVALAKSRGLSTKSSALICVGWAVFSVLTPFYHPYARLWLPIEAFGWLLLGGVFVSIRSEVEVAGRGARWSWNTVANPLPWFTLFCMISAVTSLSLQSRPQRVPVLGPSDSLRRASMTILRELPKDVKDLSAYTRPPIAYYMALNGGMFVHRQPDLAHLLATGSTTSWALLDLALVRQENTSEQELDRRLKGWTLVREIPTTLSPTTLLDIDPASRRARDHGRVGSAQVVTAQTDGGGSLNPISPCTLWPDPDALGPMTDLYELTMMAGYYSAGMADQRATFELFVRRMPDRRAFLVFAGLEQAIGDLLMLAFSPEQIESIRRWPQFRQVDKAVMDAIATLRFEGDVWSVPEGTVVFPGATLLRVTAPLPQAQWVETHLLASLAYPTLVASKAARVVGAAAGRSLFEFGARRGHGPLAGMLAARAAYLAGFTGTSHVEAARRLGIPASGTMAHSWVQSFSTETEAFATFARIFPENTTLLVDTYDTTDGVRNAAAIEPPVQAIRIDSGNLAQEARQARTILDQLGRSSIKIIASGDLDEYKIAELVGSAAPVDGFGVGTELITSRDAPALAMVYKLVELEGQGKFKRSSGKRTYPMAKQVFRRRDQSSRFCGDHVTDARETAEGEPLLIPIVRSGRLVAGLPTLEDIRMRCRDQLAALPERLHGLDALPDYPITYSVALEAHARRLMTR